MIARWKQWFQCPKCRAPRFRWVTSEDFDEAVPLCRPCSAVLVKVEDHEIVGCSSCPLASNGWAYCLHPKAPADNILNDDGAPTVDWCPLPAAPLLLWRRR